MGNLVAFINSFISYLLVFVVFAAVIIAAVKVGITARIKGCKGCAERAECRRTGVKYSAQNYTAVESGVVKNTTGIGHFACCRFVLRLREARQQEKNMKRIAAFEKVSFAQYEMDFSGRVPRP